MESLFGKVAFSENFQEKFVIEHSRVLRILILLMSNKFWEGVSILLMLIKFWRRGRFWEFWLMYTAWKVSVFRIFLVSIFPRLNWIRIRKTPNTDTFHAVIAYHFLLVYGAWIILTLVCVILGAIIFHNQRGHSREEKLSTSPPKIHIKERIKVESKSRRLIAAQIKEGQYKVCKQKVDKLLHNFVNDLIFNPVYQDLYSIVRQLKCVFVSTCFSFMTELGHGGMKRFYLHD